jgi:hypothetical protein
VIAATTIPPAAAMPGTLSLHHQLYSHNNDMMATYSALSILVIILLIAIGFIYTERKRALRKLPLWSATKAQVTRGWPLQAPVRMWTQFLKLSGNLPGLGALGKSERMPKDTRRKEDRIQPHSTLPGLGALGMSGRMQRNTGYKGDKQQSHCNLAGVGSLGKSARKQKSTQEEKEPSNNLPGLGALGKSRRLCKKKKDRSNREREQTQDEKMEAYRSRHRMYQLCVVIYFAAILWDKMINYVTGDSDQYRRISVNARYRKKFTRHRGKIRIECQKTTGI